jgi:15-cis-phytoene synthase
VDAEDAYRRCEDITGAEARNFSYGIRLLPTPKRQAMSALYALARRIDDIGDGDLPVADKREQLAATRVALKT